MSLIATLIGVTLCILGVWAAKVGYPRVWLFIPVTLMWMCLALLTGCDDSDTFIEEILVESCFPPGHCDDEDEESEDEEFRSGFSVKDPPKRMIRGS